MDTMQPIDEIRRLLEELVVPELQAITAQLRALSESQRLMAEGREAMELHLLRQIEQSKDEILLMLKTTVAGLSSENAELTKRIEEKKKTPTIQ